MEQGIDTFVFAMRTVTVIVVCLVSLRSLFAQLCKKHVRLIEQIRHSATNSEQGTESDDDMEHDYVRGSLLCFSIVFLYCVSLLYFSIVFLYCISLLHFSIVFLYCVSLLCFSIAFLYFVSLLFFSIVFLYCISLLYFSIVVSLLLASGVPNCGEVHIKDPLLLMEICSSFLLLFLSWEQAVAPW